MKKKLILIGSLLVLALVLAGCGPKKATLDVEMNEYNFIPSTFEVPAGAQVTLNLKNTGTLEHEFVIMKLGKDATIPFNDDDEPNVYWEAEADHGESLTFTFTAPTELGVYNVVCGTPAHLEQGMKATLTVK